MQQQRVARAGPYAVVHPGVGRGVVEGRTDQLRRRVGAQWGQGVGTDQVGREAVGEAGPRRTDVVLRALGHHQQHRQAVDLPGGGGEPLPGVLVGAVHIVHGHQQRRVARVREQQPPQPGSRPAMVVDGGRRLRPAPAVLPQRVLVQGEQVEHGREGGWGSGEQRARSTRMPCVSP